MALRHSGLSLKCASKKDNNYLLKVVLTLSYIFFEYPYLYNPPTQKKMQCSQGDTSFKSLGVGIQHQPLDGFRAGGLFAFAAHLETNNYLGPSQDLRGRQHRPQQPRSWESCLPRRRPRLSRPPAPGRAGHSPGGSRGTLEILLVISAVSTAKSCS